MRRNGLPIQCPPPDISLISTGKPLKDTGSFSFITYLFGHYGFRLIYNRPGTNYWEETFDLSGVITASGKFSDNHYASEYSLGMMSSFVQKVQSGAAKGTESWKPPQPK